MRLLEQRQVGEVLEVQVQYAAAGQDCPHCGRWTAKVHDRRPQRKRDVPVRDRSVVLVLWRRRFRCLWCRGPRGRPRTFSERHPTCGVGPGGRARRTTCRLRQALVAAIPHLTVKQAAAGYGVGQRLVRTCFTDHATALLAATTPERATPRVLALDDFARTRGQRYDTILCDLEARRVLDVVPGRDAAAVQPWLECLSHPERVEVVVMDMSAAYREVVQLCLPRAVIVADRFHVVRRIGEAVDQVRVRLQRMPGTPHGQVLYRLRYALRRPADAWTPAQRTELLALLAALPDLALARQHWEAFQAVYAAPNRAAAEQALGTWEQQLREGGLPEFQVLFAAGSVLGGWREELLNSFDHRVTNGYVEGKNTRTKQLIRQAYGYRNRENLRLRILLPVA